jgi:hypothetical protein
MACDNSKAIGISWMGQEIDRRGQSKNSCCNYGDVDSLKKEEKA